MRHVACATCRFYHPEESPDADKGLCHRYPPQKRIGGGAFFIEVRGDWDCGEHCPAAEPVTPRAEVTVSHEALKAGEAALIENFADLLSPGLCWDAAECCLKAALATAPQEQWSDERQVVRNEGFHDALKLAAHECETIARSISKGGLIFGTARELVSYIAERITELSPGDIG